MQVSLNKIVKIVLVILPRVQYMFQAGTEKHFSGAAICPLYNIEKKSTCTWDHFSLGVVEDNCAPKIDTCTEWYLEFIMKFVHVLIL